MKAYKHLTRESWPDTYHLNRPGSVIPYLLELEGLRKDVAALNMWHPSVRVLWLARDDPAMHCVCVADVRHHAAKAVPYEGLFNDRDRMRTSTLQVSGLSRW